MDRKDEIIRLQMDVINQMTRSNLNRIADDLWGTPAPAADRKTEVVAEQKQEEKPVQQQKASQEQNQSQKKSGGLKK